MTQRTDKKLKDLRPGDRVELENGGIGTILSVDQVPIIETAVGNECVYRVRWEDEVGDIGDRIENGDYRAIVVGASDV